MDFEQEFHKYHKKRENFNTSVDPVPRLRIERQNQASTVFKRMAESSLDNIPQRAWRRAKNIPMDIDSTFKKKFKPAERK